MSQPNKSPNPFSYIKHAREIPQEAAASEEVPEAPEPAIETRLSRGPARVPPLKREANPVRVKFTTNVAPKLRDAVELELAKQKSAEGKTQSFADLLEVQLLDWLRSRGIIIT